MKRKLLNIDHMTKLGNEIDPCKLKFLLIRKLIFGSVNGTSWILTKGDNNPGDDRPLYYEVNPNLHYLQNHHIIGRAKG